MTYYPPQLPFMPSSMGPITRTPGFNLASLPGASGGILQRGLPPVNPYVGPAGMPMGNPFTAGGVQGLAAQAGPNWASGATSSMGPMAGETLFADQLAAAAGGRAAPAATGAGRFFAGAAGIGKPGGAMTFGRYTPAAMAAGRASLPGPLATSSLARGAVPLAGNYLAGKVFGSGDENTLTEAARGFTRGASWAPVVAPAVAAIPGVNMVGLPLLAAAGGITGAVGAAADVFDLGDEFANVIGGLFGGGGEKEKPKEADADEVLANAFAKAKLPPETAALIADQYAIQMEFANTVPDEEIDDPNNEGEKINQRDQAKADALNTAGQQILQAVAQRDQMGGMGGQDLLAMQAQAMQVYEPLAANLEQNAAAYQTAMSGMLDRLPPEMRALAEAQMATRTTTSNQLADAYRAQAAAFPAYQAMNEYNAQQEAIKNSLFQMYQSQQMSPMFSSGSGTSSDQQAVQDFLTPGGGP